MKRPFLLLCAVLSASAMAQLRPETAAARPNDAAAVRRHIESIFDAFIQHDGPKLRATHSTLWRGFLEGSRVPIRGGDQYMQWNRGATTPGPNGMKAYQMSEFDPVFYGDVAVVPFVANVTASYSGQSSQRKLRILDVYAKLDGNWIQVGSHTDLHPDSLEEQQTQPGTLPPQIKQQLLADREKVWRAYFANDRAALEALPAELTTIEPSGQFGNRDSVLAGAAGFAQSGDRLKSIEFPRTELQVYGSTAIIYTTYKLTLDRDGKTSEMAGNATEIFVYRDGKWANVGWHLDAQH